LRRKKWIGAGEAMTTRIEDGLTAGNKPPIERARRFIIGKSCGEG